MDAETRLMLHKSIQDWCQDRQQLMAELEAYPKTGAFSAVLFDELNQLGLLHILFTEDNRTDIELVAEAAYQFARYSPSIALLLVQQNMASFLLAEAGCDEPKSWVALPLYDAPEEWPFQIESSCSKGAIILNGTWQCLPLLPQTETLLLPLCGQQEHDFSLARIDLLADDHSHLGHLECKHAVLTLGLRGCPLGDIEFDHYQLSAQQLIANGAEPRSQIKRLWSQAEVCMMAIRSGIFESCYNIALDYAKARWQGGKVIIQHSLIRQMLADLYHEKCALAESWRGIAATMDPQAPLSDGQLGLAFNSCQRLPWVTSEGIQLLGGIGYMEEFGQERNFRDAKQCEALLGHLQARRFAVWQSQC